MPREYSHSEEITVTTRAYPSKSNNLQHYKCSQVINIHEKMNSLIMMECNSFRQTIHLFYYVYLRVRHSVRKLSGTRSLTVPRCKCEKAGIRNRPCLHGFLVSAFSLSPKQEFTHRYEGMVSSAQPDFLCVSESWHHVQSHFCAL